MLWCFSLSNTPTPGKQLTEAGYTAWIEDGSAARSKNSAQVGCLARWGAPGGVPYRLLAQMANKIDLAATDGGNLED